MVSMRGSGVQLPIIRIDSTAETVNLHVEAPGEPQSRPALVELEVSAVFENVIRGLKSTGEDEHVDEVWEL